MNNHNYMLYRRNEREREKKKHQCFLVERKTNSHNHLKPCTVDSRYLDLAYLE